MIPRQQMKGALEAALKARQRQMSNYRRLKKQQYAELYADPACGDRFRKFVATLNHFGIADSARMRDYVTAECKRWMHMAPDEYRDAAVETVAARSMQIRERAGLLALDDPMPDQPDDVFRVCRKIIEGAT